MVESDQKINEALSELNESSDDNSRESSSQKQSAKLGINLQASEQRRKKQDALEGKEKKHSHGHTESEDEGEKAEGEHKSEDKDGDGRGAGQSNHFSMDEQQQRIIQFSSGGGVGSFGALMGLFITSASFRAEASSSLSINVVIPKISLDFVSSGFNRAEFTGAQVQAVQGASAGEHITDLTKTQNYTDNASTASRIISAQALSSGITQNIINTSSDQEDNPSINPIENIPITIGGSIYTPYFNVSNFFFQPQTQFAFSSGTGSAVTAPSTYSLNNYFNNAGLGISLEGYKITNLSTNNPTQNLPGGVTYSLSSNSQGEEIATFNVAINSGGFSSSTPLLTIDLTDPNATSIAQSDAGNMVITAPSPVSLYIDVKSGNGLILPIRLDLGPGNYITNNIINPDSIIAYDPTINQDVVEGSTTSPSVISIINTGDESTTLPVIGNIGSVNQTLESNATYTLPSNVLYWHVGDTLTNPPPGPGVYGNFETATLNLSGGNAVSLGGNVLDVFGTKYGIGQNVTLVDGGSSLNTINFGESSTGTSLVVPPGNTLAGFGTAYGDFQTLNLNYTTTSTPAQMNINFIGNTLAVDKAANSTLYPDIQNLNINITNSQSQVTGLNIVFGTENNGSNVGSSLQGNGANNIFYGDIQNFGDLGNSTLYNGFINGVNVITNNPNPLAPPIPNNVVAVEDSNGNVIEFANDTYTGGSYQVGSGMTETPTNTYNFTLLGSTANQPIMEGNALITNFNSATDQFIFQLTPNLFQALEGLDGAYTKSISIADLMKDTNLAAINSVSDPTWYKVDTQLISGTVLDFSGGGSITLENFPLMGDNPITLNDLNISFQVNYSYQPMVAIVPSSIPLFGIGGLAQSNNIALDQFFTNSIFANYSVSTTLPSGISIDSYGNITVGNHDAFLGYVTVTATDVPNTTLNISTSQFPYSTSTTIFTGMLDAPETIVVPGSGSNINVETASSISASQSASTPVIGSHSANIIDDTVSGSTVIGSLGNEADSSGNSNADLIVPVNSLGLNNYYGGNLIIDTAGNTTAYGTNENITILDDFTLVNNVPQSLSITGQYITFYGNALDIAGTSYGLTNNFDFTAEGPINQSITLTSGTINDSVQYTTNHITIDGETLYGNGILYGDGNVLNIAVDAGANNNLTGLKTLQGDASLNISATVTGNTFMIDGVTIHVQGDTSTQTTTIYPNFASLNISLDPTFEKVISTQVQTTSSATFSSNAFIFGNDTLIGGNGNTIFQTMMLDTPSLPDLGFNGLVSVSSSGGVVVTTDGSGNSIQWGNNLYMGGAGTNTYNFTLLEDINSGVISGTSTAVMTGNETIQNFNTAKDVVVFNLEADLYQQIQSTYGFVTPQILDQVLTLQSPLTYNTDRFGNSYTFNVSGGNTVITFYDPITNQQTGSLTLDGVQISSFSDWAELYPNSIRIEEIPTTNNVSPTFNTHASFDPVFINLAQPQAFEGLINTNTTSLLNLNYTATGLPAAVSLSLDGTLATNVTTPIAAEVTITAIDPITGDSVTALRPELLFFSNANQIIYDTNSGSASVFNGSSATPGAYEVQDATVYGTGSSAIDLSGGGVTEQSQLIYDTSTGSAHTIYGDTQYIGDAISINSATPSASITGQAYSFGGILLDINTGISGQDNIYGNAQSFTIAPTGSGSFGGNTPALGNTLTFASNTIYGTGVVFGNFQVLDLDASSGTSSISNNNFHFLGNQLTSGVSLGGSSTLIADTAQTNLYADISTLEITGNVTSNALTFGNSTLTGVGPTNFYADIANLSQTDFVSNVTENNTPSNPVKVTDQLGNSITFGNDTFIEGSGSNTYTFTVMDQAQGSGVNTTYNPIFEGNDTIQGFKPGSDTLVLNIASPLYNQLVQGASSSTLTASELNSVSSSTSSSADFYFDYNSSTDSTTIFMKGGGSLTIDGQDLTSFSDFTTLPVNYAYYAEPITTNTPSSQVLLFNGNNTYYSEFYPYFNNVNIEKAGTTYSISSAIPEISFSSTSGLGLFALPAATGTPMLELVNIGINDVNFSSNHPTVTSLVGFFDGSIATNSAVNPITGALITLGNVVGGSGDLFENNYSNIFQGNTGNATQISQNDTYAVVTSTSETTASTQTLAGDNLFIDTAGNVTAYGDFQNIVYTDSNTSTATPVELDIENQTYTYNPNAFDVGGTVYGVSDTLSITVSAGNNISDANSTADSASSVVSYNNYDFGNETVFGSGTIYGDLNTLSIALNAGSNDTESGAGTLSVSADFTHNNFNFAANQIVVLGNTSTQTTTIYPDLQSLLITTDSSVSKIIALNQVVPTTEFSHNAFVFGNATVVGGAGNMVVQADPILNNTSSDAYNGFINPVSVDGSSGNIVTTTTDSLSNSIQWGNNIFVSGAGTNTYNFTLLDNASGTYTNGVMGTLNTPGTDTYAVFLGNDTINGFKPGTDIITLNLEPNLYNQIVQAVQSNFGYTSSNTPSGGALLDLAGVAEFSYDLPTNTTTIVFGNNEGSLKIIGADIQSFTQLQTSNSLVIKEITNPNYVAPTVNTQVTLDPVFLNGTAQPEAFEGLVNSSATNASSLTYTTTSTLPSGVTLESNGTLDLSGVTGPESVIISVTATDSTTGDSVSLPTERIFVNNAPDITYDTTSGAGSTFNANGSTNQLNAQSGAYEVQDATVYGVSSQNNLIDLSQGAATEQSQLIYDSSSGSAAHTIYGDTSSIIETSSSAISGTDTFSSNLIDANVGITGLTQGSIGSDQIYGNAHDLTIAPSISGSGSSLISGSFENNILNFGPNTVYGTGSVYGNFQVLDLDATAGTGVVISGNNFTLGGNILTSGAYIGGSNTPIGDTATSSLYAGIGSLEMGVSTNGSLATQITNNIFTFGNSILTGVGPTDFYGDIADLSNTDFILPVSIVAATGVVSVKDQSGNIITFGNDTFIEGSGSNTYNFNVMAQSQGTGGATIYNPIFEGNYSIQGFNPSTDTLVLSIASPLYNQLVQGSSNSTLTVAELNAVSSTTSSSADFYFDYNSSTGNTTISMKEGGSLTIDGQDLTNFSSFTTLPLNYEYYPTAITGNTFASQALLFNGSNNFYSEFYPYFNNVNIENSSTTYSLSSALPGVSFTSSSGLGLFTSPTATGAPELELVNVGMNDVNDSTNHPTTIALVAYSNGNTATNVVAGTLMGNAVGGAGDVFEGTTGSAFQGNAGNTTQTTTNDTYAVVTSASETTTSTQTVAGDNLFIDTAGSNTAYGDFQNIVYTDNNASTITAAELDVKNQTYNYQTNDFDISGTTYGAANSIQINIMGAHSLSDTTITTDSASSVISQNNYNFAGQTIFGSGEAYGDANTLTFNLTGGSNNTELGTGTLTVQAEYQNNSFTFGSNVIDMNASAGNNTVYGNLDALTIQTEGGGTNSTTTGTINASANFGGISSAQGNHFTFDGNIIDSTGTVYGDIQTLNLDVMNSNATISHNTFTFDANTLTSGYYGYSSTAPVGSSSTSNLYAGIGALEFNAGSGASLQTQITDNNIVFKDSTLTGVGSTNFYADIADLSQSDFVLGVNATPVSGHVEVSDQGGNTITFGNDTFIEGSGSNTYNFTVMAQTNGSGSSTTYTPIFEGNDTIQGFNPSTDTLVLNIASPLYNQLAAASSGSPAITVTELNSVSSTTSSLADFYFDYNATTNSTTIFMQGGGSLTIDGQHITNFSSFSHLTTNYVYFDPPITVNSNPANPLIFNGANTYYNEIASYFNNENITDPNTTLTVTNTLAESSSSSTSSNLSLWTTPAATGTPVLELVNVGMTDVNDSTNHPNITTLVGYFNGAEAKQNGSSMMGSAVGGAGELLQGSANDILQGNAGNTANQTTYDANITESNTIVSTQTVAGNNMIIDTQGVNNTTYGAFEEILYNYSNDDANSYESSNSSNSSHPVPSELIVENQTINYASNAFDVQGTTYGVSNSLQINVEGENNVTSSNTGIARADTVVSNNTYNFADQTIFGSGTAYGDLNTLNIDLQGGSNNTELGSGILNSSAAFTNNTFNFGSNTIDMIGQGSNNTIVGNVENLVVTEEQGTTNAGNVTSSGEFSGNQFIFGDDTLIGGAGTNDFIGHAQNFSLTPSVVNDSNYGGAGFYDGDIVNVTTNAQGEELLSITDRDQNTITWGNDTYTGGTSGVNTYNFTIVGTEGRNPQAIMQGFDTITNFNINSDKLSFALTNSLYEALDGYKGTSLTIAQLLNSKGITITQNSGAAILNFAGGGSITLDGYGALSGYTPQAIEAALIKNNSISISITNPVSSVSTLSGTGETLNAIAATAAVAAATEASKANSPHQHNDTAVSSAKAEDHAGQSFNPWGADALEKVAQDKYEHHLDISKASLGNNAIQSHETHMKVSPHEANNQNQSLHANTGVMNTSGQDSQALFTHQHENTTLHASNSHVLKSSNLWKADILEQKAQNKHSDQSHTATTSQDISTNNSSERPVTTSEHNHSPQHSIDVVDARLGSLTNTDSHLYAGSSNADSALKIFEEKWGNNPLVQKLTESRDIDINKLVSEAKAKLGQTNTNENSPHSTESSDSISQVNEGHHLNYGLSPEAAQVLLDSLNKHGSFIMHDFGTLHHDHIDLLNPFHHIIPIIHH